MGEAFDIVLVVMLVVTCWRVMISNDGYQAVILFVVFGMLLSLAWVRIGAPDVAMAEVAIGTGLSGVLLLGALGRTRAHSPNAATVRARLRNTAHGARPFVHALPPFLVRVLPAAVIACTLYVAVAGLPREPGGLTEPVRDQLGATGVEQPVTAVLLSFRGYDTWLEIGVLLLALLSLLALRRSIDLRGYAAAASDNVLVDALARVVVPMMMLVAAYLYISGTEAPGGAFQAGAVGAAALVLLRMAGFPSVASLQPPVLRTALLLAFATFVVVAIGSGLASGGILEYRGRGAEPIILALEAAIALTTAVTLASLYVASEPAAGTSAAK